MDEYTQEFQVPALGVTVSITVRPIATPPDPVPPNFVVTGLSVNPSPVALGAAWTATATVTNQGGPGTAEIIIGYIMDGVRKPLNGADPSRMLTLEAGATGTVVWSGIGSSKGTWTLYAGGLTVELVVGDLLPSVKTYRALFTVTDTEKGTPQPGATVTVGTLTAVTDATGQTTIEPLSAGAYEYTVTMADYAPFKGQFPVG